MARGPSRGPLPMLPVPHYSVWQGSKEVAAALHKTAQPDEQNVSRI